MQNYSLILSPFSTGLILRLLPILVLVMYSNNLLAQQPDSLKTKKRLQETKVIADKEKELVDTRNEFTSGQQKLAFDSVFLNFYRNLSLSELIMEQSPVFIKSFGVNNMATLNIRGSSAAQSLVLWNGIPISNAATGQSDISLLSGGLFEDISIQYGGSSALFGSGNVGGALLLDNHPPEFRKSKSVDATIGVGSFGQLKTMLQGEWQNNHLRFDLKVFQEQAKNNFSYENRFGEDVKMDNAALKGTGAMLNADYLFRKRPFIKKQTLSLRLWYQDYNRQIPPALFESSSVKQQQNQDFHSLIHWNQERKRSRFYAKLAFHTESMRYQDGVILPDNHNTVYQTYSEIGWHWKINHPETAEKWLHQFMVFAPLQWSFIRGQNLSSFEEDLRPAIAAAYKLLSVNGRYDMNIALRHEWWNQQEREWLPGWNGKFQLLNGVTQTGYWQISALANIQKSFRTPTLNELYFSPGGNPSLMPERGWNQDGGVMTKWTWNEKGKEQSTIEIVQQTSVFNRHIKDWIYWLGGAIWTPHNLAAVHSRGVETENKVAWNRNSESGMAVGFKTAYVLATTTKIYLHQDGSIGKQIPYTPRYNYMGNLNFWWRKIFVNYNHQYTGYRFITTDESQFLLPYQSGNLQVSYGWGFKNYSFILSGQVRNLWNHRYEVVNGRPAAGRNFLISLKAGWKE